MGAPLGVDIHILGHRNVFKREGLFFAVLIHVEPTIKGKSVICRILRDILILDELVMGDLNGFHQHVIILRIVRIYFREAAIGIAVAINGNLMGDRLPLGIQNEILRWHEFCRQDILLSGALRVQIPAGKNYRAGLIFLGGVRNKGFILSQRLFIQRRYGIYNFLTVVKLQFESGTVIVEFSTVVTVTNFRGFILIEDITLDGHKFLFTYRDSGTSLERYSIKDFVLLASIQRLSQICGG